MASPWYTPTGSPSTSSSGTSATMRAEFAAIETALDKLPSFSGNASKIVAVNSGETALEAVSSVPVGSGGTGAVTHTEGGILLGAGTSAITALAVLADGAIAIGDGVTYPTSLTAFTSSTGTLKHEYGGVEADISTVADGGIVVGTGAGTMAVRAGVMTAGAAGFLKHEVGGIEADISAIADGGMLVGTGAGTMAVRAGVMTAGAAGFLKHEVGGVEADISAVTDGDVIVGTGSGTMGLEKDATLRTTLGLGTGNSPTFTGLSLTTATVSGAATLGSVELGHATDTTLARTAAGKIAVEGSAVELAGRNTLWIPAGAMRPTVSNGCAILTDVETTAGRPDQQVLYFDGSSEEHAQFQIAFPKSWDEGTVTFKPFWTGATGSGTVIWGLQGVAVSNDDTIDVAYGTAKTSSDTFVVAEDLHVGPESSAITIAGTPTEGDISFFDIYRDATSDSKSEDGGLVGIQVFWTTDDVNDQ